MVELNRAAARPSAARSLARWGRCVLAVATGGGGGAAPAAAPPDPVEAVRAIAAADLRVGTVGYRLLTSPGALALCTPAGRATGLLLQDAAQYAPTYRPALAALFHAADDPAITGVVPGSPAERAGVAVGDRLAAIDGQPLAALLPPPGSPAAGARRYAALLDGLDAALATGPLTLDLVRDGRPLRATLAGAPACPVRIQLDLDRVVRARTDGRVIHLASGFLDRLADDNELAFVLGHELAHILLRTDDARRPTRCDEAAADRLGLILATGAGFAPEAGAALLRRLASLGIGGDRGEATDAARAETLDAAAHQIRARLAAGQAPGPDTLAPCG